MTEPQRERTGVLVVRAWIEPAAEQGFRARVTSRVDVDSTAEQIRTAASVGATLEIVRAWLEAFVTAP